MTRYVIVRVFQAGITLILVSLLVFILTSAIGDPINQLLPIDATDEMRAALRARLGYDRPFIRQYLSFLSNAAVGDFGRSVAYRQPALPLVADRMSVTVMLAMATLTVSFAIALPLGALAGYRHSGWIDRVISSLASIGQALPGFVIALVLIYLFGVRLSWLPTSGDGGLTHFVLPVVTLTIFVASAVVRLTRTAMREVMQRAYITLARSKGMSEPNLVLRHALRNCLLPVVTYGGLQFGALLTGAVIVETVFALPGMGKLAIDAVGRRDTNVVMAAVMVGSTLFVLVTLLTDLLHSVVDPRIRLGGGQRR